MFNKAHYLIRLENDPDQHMAGNNQKYDVKKISRQVVMYQIDRLDVFIGLLTGSSALCKVFSSRFKAGELSFIFIFTWVKQADFEKVICLRYILSCASTMQAPCIHIQGPRKCYGSTVQAHCKLTMRTLVKHNQVNCVRALVREIEQAEDARPSCRRRSRTSARRLHELNNPRLGKNCRGKWNFPTRGGKKRRRANPPAGSHNERP